MKKSLSFALMLIICISLTACNKEATKSNQSDNNQPQAIQEETSQPQTVVVPNVVGMDKDEAVKTLEDLGLKVEVEIERLVPINNNTFEVYPNNYILEQSHSEGTVVVANTIIKIILHKKETSYTYKINEDNTITLNSLIKREHGVDEIIVPNEYDNYVVSAITSEVVDSVGSTKNIIVPKNIKIIGEPHCSYELR